MKYLFSLVFMSFAMISFSQEFLEGAFRFSSKKEAYFTLANGEEIVGIVDDIDRKKGLIESIKVKTENGTKRKFTAEEIKHMYLAPSGFDNYAAAMDKTYDAQKWNKDESVHAEHIKKGYVYFENTRVIVKKKERTMLLQLLNPGFADRIKVYFDPFAGETAGLSVGGIQVTGGDDKSYYFRKDGGVAFLLEKKNYSDEFPSLYLDCDSFKSAHPDKPKWKDAEKHVFYYSENCQ